MVMLQRWSLMEGEFILRRREWNENCYVTEVVTLMEGKWSCYRGGQFIGSMVMLQRWSVKWRASSYRGGQFDGGRMVMLQRWSLMEGEWSFYRGGQFNGGRKVMLCGQFNGVRMVMLRRWSV